MILTMKFPRLRYDKTLLVITLGLYLLSFILFYSMLGDESKYVLLLLALAVGFAGIWGLYPYHISKNWEKIRAKIVSFEECSKYIPVGKMRWVNHIYPRLIYSYEFNNREYISNQVVFHLNDILLPEFDADGQKLEHRDKPWRDWCENLHIDIFVNPKDAEEAVVFKDAADSVIIACYTLLLGGLACLLFWGLMALFLY